jgi:hypothetical protein
MGWILGRSPMDNGYKFPDEKEWIRSGVTNSLGTVVDVQQIGPARDRLVAVGPPVRPADDRGPAGPRRRPPPPELGPQATPPLPPQGLEPAPGSLTPPPPPPSG